jgi:hypothetical protein
MGISLVVGEDTNNGQAVFKQKSESPVECYIYMLLHKAVSCLMDGPWRLIGEIKDTSYHTIQFFLLQEMCFVNTV